MSIQHFPIIYNTLSRQKNELKPRQAGHIGMYVCGMTVYDLCHLGHGRMLVSFDVIRRWLLTTGYTVTFVRNITDIDDKIINRAIENNESISDLTARTIAAMHEDCLALNILPPTHEPRATEYIPQMLSMIHTLESKGLAYQSQDGDVNYAVRAFKGYGKLSGKSLDDLQSGERVSVNAHKRDPLDFVLWKQAKPSDPSDATWQGGKYGLGRPGWHIECSAMSCALLGKSFDIHGGGPDLKFPHHENEIAQSEGANEQTLADIWMHCGPLNVNDAKMSKSLGNFFTLRDLFKQHDPEVVRFMLSRVQYRSIMNYSPDLLNESKVALSRLYNALLGLPTIADAEANFNTHYGKAFAQAMNDDFNTPEAFAVLFEMANEINKTRNLDLAAQFKALANILGILQREPTDFFTADHHDHQGLTASEITLQINERAIAKKNKDFIRADNIRKTLLDAKISLEDTPNGTLWKRL
jgi:cysteinyl-tRNA synthetase